jgi:hypothetical protein
VKSATPIPTAEPSGSTSEARSPEPEVRSPPFWFSFSVSWSKLALGRAILFSLLALDALMQLRHAPRYGAGGFNVGQLSIFDSLGPSRITYTLGELVNAYLFATIAFGVATRIALPITAAIYSYLYFGSQLDSYQHHYLVALALWLCCFVPWERPDGATAATPVRSWALRLLLVQLAIMYLWAAISKMSPAWWNGDTLGEQITGSLRKVIDATVGIRTASRLVIPTELALACTVWLKPAWRVAAPLGIAFHLGIVASGLEIGLFAWLMIALYVFVVPDAIWIAVARALAPLHIVPTARSLAARAGWLVLALAAALSIACAVACRFPLALGVAIVLVIALGARAFRAAVRGRPAVATLGAVHLVAIAAWLVVDRHSAIAGDYFRYWGASERRFGSADAALDAYSHLVAITPDDPAAHYQLGRLLLAHDRSDEALAELHASEQLDSAHARAFVAEARWLAEHGRRDEALTAVRAALRAEPDDREARALLELLQR